MKTWWTKDLGIGQTIPNGYYKVLVVAAGDESIRDESDDWFSIISSPDSVPLGWPFPVGVWAEFKNSIRVATEDPKIILIGEVIIYRLNQEEKWIQIKMGFNFAHRQIGKNAYRVIEVIAHEKGRYAISFPLLTISVGVGKIWITKDGVSTARFMEVTPPSDHISGDPTAAPGLSPPSPPPDPPSRSRKSISAKESNTTPVEKEGRIAITWGKVKRE